VISVLLEQSPQLYTQSKGPRSRCARPPRSARVWGRSAARHV